MNNCSYKYHHKIIYFLLLLLLLLLQNFSSKLFADDSYCAGGSVGGRFNICDGSGQVGGVGIGGDGQGQIGRVVGGDGSGHTSGSIARSQAGFASYLESLRENQRALQEIDRQRMLRNEQYQAELRRQIALDTTRNEQQKQEYIRKLKENRKYKDLKDEYFTFETPITDKNWRSLRKTRQEIVQAQEWLNQNPEISYWGERQALISTSDFLVANADREYSQGNDEDGDQLLNKAIGLLDLVADFVPGISLVKDSLSLITGHNPLTGEKLSDLEIGLVGASLLAPSFISGTGKGITQLAKRLGQMTQISDRFKKVAASVLSAIKNSDELLTPFLNRDTCVGQCDGQMIGQVTESILEDFGVKEAKFLESASSSAQKVGVETKEGIKDFADLSKRIAGNDRGAVGDLSKVIKGKMVRYGPLKSGPLHKIKVGNQTVADTFRSSSYFETVLEEPLKVYRVYGGEAGELGSYWSRVKPTGPGQATLDAALLPNFRNSAQKVAEVTIPAGTKIFEGVASPQVIDSTGSNIKIGELLGNGSQVYIDTIIDKKTWNFISRGFFE